ncbi:hypothetical protein [Nitrosovibrio sp. Nv6]|uniref:hypothetical protein n=1 Tax=Nitrosovibrio sp. Nv6 TaxID=1855340 RepID=UPI000A435607|nr:hypothetical protein [Nitrosovibrio sp. Nv6]
MPISAIDGYPASHWDEVFLIIKEALSETRFNVELVSNSDEIGVIQKRIVQNIYDNEIVICDVSAKNPNVMFELGMRLAFDKPAIIIKDNRTNYSFDTAPIEHLEYPVELNHRAIQDFQTKLRDKVIATFEASKHPEYTTFLKHFGQFIVANIEEKKVGKDDYLLEAISELRTDIRALRRTVAAPTSVSVSPFIGSALHRHIANETRTQWAINNALKTENELIEFIKGYLGDDINQASLADLQNPDSKLFKGMFKHLCKSTYAHDYLGETKMIEEALVSAANRLNHVFSLNNWTAPE